MQVKIRDLEKSRAQWKAKATQRKNENNVLKQEYENIKKKLKTPKIL